MADPKQHVEMAFSQRMQLINGVDAGRTQSDLAKEFNIERTTVTRLKCKKDGNKSIAESNNDLNQTENYWKSV